MPFLALGTLTTLAICWCAGATAEPPSGPGTPLLVVEERTVWAVRTQSDWVSSRSYWGIYTSLGVRHLWPDGTPQDFRSQPARERLEALSGTRTTTFVPFGKPREHDPMQGYTDVWASFGFGSPWRAMWHIESERDDARAGAIELPWARVPASKALSHGAFPLRIYWPGFAADALVWSAAWLAAVGSIRHSRAWTRKNRGLCPSCAYDLRGDLARGCSECGWGRAARPPAVVSD